MKVLVVDDSSSIRQIIRNNLIEIGCDLVLEAKNGLEGISLVFENNDIDFCLVDWNMPKMDGFQFLEKMRAHDDYKSIPIIMVSTESTLQRVGLAIDAGANGYIVKPFTNEVLQERLRDILEDIKLAEN
ncbi:MAG: two-component system response regulator [Planctomycetota bacterium]|nr:MAG: two-component system response regulator [Planctomycetota bacterium]